jgi:hypothetical protein
VGVVEGEFFEEDGTHSAVESIDAVDRKKAAAGAKSFQGGAQGKYKTLGATWNADAVLEGGKIFSP